MRRIVIVLAILLAAAGFVWWRSSAPVTVHLAQVERDVEARVFGIGTIEAQIAAQIGFQLAGRVTTVHAEQGQIHDKGTVLAQLDVTVQQARYQKALVALQQVENTIAKSLAQLKRAEVNMAQKKAIAERRLALVSRGAVTREAADEARAQFQIAEADVEVAKAEYALISATRKDLAASVAIEKALLDQHTLLAPFRARILNRLKETGSAVNPGEPVYSLIAPETIWVRAHIDEAMAGAIKAGQTAWVRLRSDPQTVVEAEVIRIDEENDRVTEERRVHVRCRACRPEHLARHLGEQAEVEIVTRKIASGLLLPLYAVNQYNGRSGKVWTLADGKLAERTIALGDRLLDGRVLVSEKLPDGVAIVIDRDQSGFRAGKAAIAAQEPRK